MQIQFQRFILVSVLLSTLILGACDSPKKGSVSTTNTSTTTTTTTPSTPPTPDTSTNQFPGLVRLNGKATVEMVIKGKTITIELDGNNAPITAGNFAELVKKGFYNGLTFHRVEREPQPFVVQGGDPKGVGTGGYIPEGATSERQIPLEIKPKGAAAPIYSQLVDDVPQLQHKRGSIAMARSMSPDSASSQFYFALSDLPPLDGKYAVFGNITKGLEVIDTIQKGDKITSAKVTKGIENLK